MPKATKLTPVAKEAGKDPAKAAKHSKSEATRAHILETALRLFRKKGFDDTTMRDIAAAAGLSLGASYYYFPTKEAIVMAFYDHVNSEHYERAHAAMLKAKTFRERLAISISTKLDILREDRRLLIALFRYGGDPDHPLSWFGKGTEPQRKQAMAVFREAIGDEKLPPDVRKVAPMLLWTAHMGVILYFLYDKSPGQKKTRALLDEGLDLLVQAFEMSSIAMLQPLLAPTRSKILKLLKDAELLPEE